VIQFQSVTFAYEGEPRSVLKGATFAVAPGEHVVLSGPNGCGKTTLLKHLNALLIPTTGEVSIDGLNTQDRRHAPEIRRRVGMVFQNPDRQIVGMTVEEDVAFGPGNLGLPPADIRRRVDAALAAVDLDALRRRSSQALSGGEKRLLAIAGVLAMEPRYLALDEPTAYLDPVSRRRVFDTLDRLQREGIAIVHVTHDLDALLNAGRLLSLDGGVIRHDGKPRVILKEPGVWSGLGLETPPVARLLERLRQGGADLPADVLTVEEAARALKGLLAGRDDGGKTEGGPP